jgi:hypothetical protein
MDLGLVGAHGLYRGRAEQHRRRRRQGSSSHALARNHEISSGGFVVFAIADAGCTGPRSSRPGGRDDYDGGTWQG